MKTAVMILSIGIVCAIWYILVLRKRVTDRSKVDSAVCTIGTSISKKIDNICNTIRTPEAVRDELLAKLEKAKEQFKKDFNTYLTELIRNHQMHSTLYETNRNKIVRLKNQAREQKRLYISTNDDKHKNLADRFISNIIALEKVQERSKRLYEHYATEKEFASTNYTLILSDFDVKYSEIVSMLSDPTTTLDINMIDVDALLNEYQNKLKERDVQLEVQKITNPITSKLPDTNASIEDINNYYEQL